MRLEASLGLILLAAGACAPRSGTSAPPVATTASASAVEPPPTEARTSPMPWRLPVPEKTHLVGRADLGVLIANQAPDLARVEVLEACGVSPNALMGEVQFAIAAPDKLLARLYADITPSQLACLLGLERAGGDALPLGPFQVAELPGGGIEFRSFTPEQATSEPRLLRKLEPLMLDHDVAVVAEVGPPEAPITLELFGDKPVGNEQRGTLRLRFPSAARAASARTWLTSAITAGREQAPVLSRVAVEAHDAVLTVRLAMEAEMARALRAHVLEPFKIPSESGLPTLAPGDYVVLAKAPEARRVQRGDLIAFQPPEGNGGPFIKRVIGVAGDRVAVLNGELLLNGQPLPVQALSDSESGALAPQGSVWLETLGDRSYRTLRLEGARSEEFPEQSVPEGHVFVVGDNRDNSHDSRHFGPVSEQAMLGKASFIYFSVGEGLAIRWERIGQVVE